MFMWSVRTLTQALREHFPESTPYLEEIAAAWGTPEFEPKFADLYPRAKTSALTMLCWSLAPPRVSTLQTFTVCGLILDGMILARGPRSTNTTP